MSSRHRLVVAGLPSQQSALSLPDSPDTCATVSRYPFASGASYDQQLPLSGQASASGQSSRQFAAVAGLSHAMSQQEPQPGRPLVLAEHEQVSMPQAATMRWTQGGTEGLTALPGSEDKAQQQAGVTGSEGVSQQGQLVTALSSRPSSHRGPGEERLSKSEAYLRTERNLGGGFRDAVTAASRQQCSGEADTDLDAPQRLKGGSETKDIEHGSQDPPDTHKGPLQGHFQTVSKAEPPPPHTQGSAAPMHPEPVSQFLPKSGSTHTQQSGYHHADEPSELSRSARTSFGLTGSYASPSRQRAKHALSPFATAQRSAAHVSKPEEGQAPNLKAAYKPHRSDEFTRQRHRLQIATGIMTLSICSSAAASATGAGATAAGAAYSLKVVAPKACGAYHHSQQCIF